MNIIPDRIAANRSLAAARMNRDSLYCALMSSIFVNMSAYSASNELALVCQIQFTSYHIRISIRDNSYWSVLDNTVAIVIIKNNQRYSVLETTSQKSLISLY